MGTVSVRLSDELEKELNEYIEEEKLEKSVAVRKLISDGLEDWRKETALEKLEKGEASFSRAAEIADMNLWDFADLVEQNDITWIKEGVEGDLETT